MTGDYDPYAMIGVLHKGVPELTARVSSVAKRRARRLSAYPCSAQCLTTPAVEACFFCLKALSRTGTASLDL